MYYCIFPAMLPISDPPTWAASSIHSLPLLKLGPLVSCNQLQAASIQAVAADSNMGHKQWALPLPRDSEPHRGCRGLP